MCFSSNMVEKTTHINLYGAKKAAEIFVDNNYNIALAKNPIFP